MNVVLKYTSDRTGEEVTEIYDAAVFRRVISAGFFNLCALEKQEGSSFPSIDKRAQQLALTLKFEIRDHERK